jgi:hypothetical protein
MRGTKNPPRAFVGKLDERKLHGSLRHRWGDNMNVATIEMRCESVDLTHVAQDRIHLLAHVKKYRVVRC